MNVESHRCDLYVGINATAYCFLCDVAFLPRLIIFWLADFILGVVFSKAGIAACSSAAVAFLIVPRLFVLY